MNLLESRKRRLAFQAALLASSALYAVPAMANCDITASPNTVSCAANTATTDTINTDAATASSADRKQEFTGGGDVIGSISSGVTVGGYGLGLETSQDGANITFTNNGALDQATSIYGGSGGLELRSTTGALTYNSASGATIDSVATSALMLFSTSSSATGDITAHVNGNISNVGSYAAHTGVIVQSNAAVKLLIDGTGDISGGTGIYAYNTAGTGAEDGDITISGSGNITYTDPNGYGIQVTHGANAGTVTIDRTGTITGAGAGAGGNNNGILVSSSGTGGTFITGVGAISDVRFGIYAYGTDNFTVAPGAAISASNNGILIQATGSGTSDITSAYDITTTAGAAISSSTAAGHQTVNVTGGTLSGIGAVKLYSTSTGLMTFNMSGGTLLSSSGAAISADQNGPGSIVVNQTGGSIGLVGTPAADTGIFARARSGGSVDITADTVYATNQAVWSQVTGAGTAHIVTNGGANSTSSSAVYSSAATGTTTIINNGTLKGGTAVVNASSTTGTISITNNAAGIITSNLATPETQTAISTSGGATTIGNAGTLTGLMTLANAANTVTNDGTWTTNGANDFGTGATTLTNNGTINVGAASSFNGGTLNVDNTATGQIVGPLTIGTGTWSNNGLITGNVTVNGGVLGGNGTTVGDVTINNGGILAPGNSIGTVNITGNLIFGAGGIYRVEVSSAAADKTIATGTATLTGATVNAVTVGSGFTVGTSYTILTATGGLGGTTFSGLTISGSLSAYLTYDATNVYLTVGSVGLVNSLNPGTINQRNVAAGIDTAMNGGATAGGFATVLGLSGTALTNALDQLSGEVASGAPTAGFQSTGQFLSLLTGRFGPTAPSADGATPLGYAAAKPVTAQAAAAYAAVTPKDKASAFDRRWGVWASAYGGDNRTNGDRSVQGSHDISTQAYGIAAGADYRVNADTVLGFALGGGGTHWGLNDVSGSGRSDAFQLGGYASRTFGASYITGALAYAWHHVTTDRSVTISGTDRLEAAFNAQSFGGRIETGHRFATAWGGVTPYAALQLQAFSTPGYSETATSGSNAFAVAYGSKTTKDARTELGARFDKTMALSPSQVLTLRARAAWAHDSSTERSASGVFQTLPGSNFTVYGAAAAANAALLSAGADLRFANNVTVSGRIDGELASQSRGIAGQLSLRYDW